MPSTPYPIYGILYDTDGSTPIASTTVKIRNESTNETTSVTTNSSGQFVLDCGNFASGWTNGDYVTVYAIYTNYSASTTVQIDTTSYPAGINQDLTLAAVSESALRYFTPQEFLDTFDLNSYENDNENGVKVNTIIKVGESVEEMIDQVTGKRWDSNDGSYTTITNEYHNADGAGSNWPENVGVANSSSQGTYFTRKTPIQSLTTFEVNGNASSTTPSWTTLTEANNEIRVRGNIGRIEITDTANYPASGPDQVRITYTYGGTTVPKDIKRLAILMTARAFGGQQLQRLNIDVTEAQGLSSAIQNLGSYDKEINDILYNRTLYEVRPI